MINKYIGLLLCLVLCLGATLNVVADKHKQEKKELSVDGPYVMYEPSGKVRVISVDQQRKLHNDLYPTVQEVSTFTVTAEKGNCSFQVKLHPLHRPEWKRALPEKLLAISDPHSDFISFVSILKAQKVIDEKCRWSFGKNELLIIGDVFDRGVDAVTLFWLIYQLEQEAMDAGGRVTFLLGNHEEMVARNNIRYVKKKYLWLAEELKMPYNALWGKNSELGRWLRSRNLIEVVDGNLFVHAGLSEELLQQKMSIPEINRIASESLGQKPEDRNEAEKFIFGGNGPYWYRGMVSGEDKYNPLSKEGLSKLLKEYEVNRIIVGHTIFDDITTFYHQQVIAIDVDAKDNREDGFGRGILIEKNKVSIIYDSGKTKQLIP
ncbi:MAG: metallophosphoesterase [Odoribacter sp.]